MNMAMMIALIRKYSNSSGGSVSDNNDVRFNVLADNLTEVIDDESHIGLFKYDVNHNLDSMNVIVQAYDDGELFDVADTVAVDENNVSVYFNEKKNCRLVILVDESGETGIAGIGTKPFDIENGSLA